MKFRFGTPPGRVVRRPHHVDMWWDRALRLWTLQLMDAEGNQIVSAQYAPRKAEALRLKAIMEEEIERCAAL